MTKRVYCISGWGLDRAFWKKIISALKLEEYTIEIILWNELLDEYSIDKVDITPGSIILGWSIGGLQSLKIAKNNLENIEALILISATPNMCESKLYRGSTKSSLEKIKKGIEHNRQSAFDYFSKICFLPNRAKEEIESFVCSLQNNSSEDLVEGLNFLISTDYCEVLEDLDLPVLLIHGASDQIVPYESSGYLSKKLKNVQFELVDGYGHSLMIVNPDLVSKTIKRFINENSKL